jgi:hypothetical protein
MNPFDFHNPANPISPLNPASPLHPMNQSASGGSGSPDPYVVGCLCLAVSLLGAYLAWRMNRPDC